MITIEKLDALRASLPTLMSEKRYRHTVEVEKMAVRLSELYAPDKVMVLRAAALLHDITKEYTLEQHLEVCHEYGLEVTEEHMLAPKTFHARTAAALIPDFYPELAEDEVISAVRYHTTGREGMTVPEKLVYLADYIDMSRTFEDCVRLREFFMGVSPELLDQKARYDHLSKTLIKSYNMTVSALLDEGLPISVDTMAARNQLIRESLTN